jgi:glycosyltransferase involved in cell wall biosynthesis
MVEGLVSTLIPVYNRPAMLREAVDSVLAQTYRPIEVIVIDDGSTDDTGHVADELARAHPQDIRVIHQANAGTGLAREAGRQALCGEFVQHLDSDDVLLPGKFEKEVAGLHAHPECGVAYGKTRFCRRGERLAAGAWKRTGEDIASMFPSLLQSRWWGTSTPLYRRELIDRAGRWTSLRNDEDWEYDCRIASFGVRLHYVPEFASEERDHDEHRVTGGSTKDRRKLSDRARAHALILGHAHRAGLTEASPEMRHFARELFLLSRQCGAAGLATESQELFALAKKASGEIRAKGWDFRLYSFLAWIVGWTRMGKVACYSDTLRG